MAKTIHAQAAKTETAKTPRVYKLAKVAQALADTKPADQAAAADTKPAETTPLAAAEFNPYEANALTAEQAAAANKPAGVRYILSRRDAQRLSGDRLLAHTQGFLTACGALDGRPMPLYRAALCQISDTAFTYHKGKGNLTYSSEDGSPVLTEQGIRHFSARKPGNAGLVAAFATMFTTGEVGAGLGLTDSPIKVGA